MKLFAFAALVLGTVAGPALAGEPWIAAGDTRVRHDVQFLVDEGVIDLPMSAWPIATSDLAAALARIKSEPSPQPSPQPSPAKAGEGARRAGEGGLSQAQAAAVARLRKIAREGRPQLGVDIRGASRPTTLRTFEDTPREQGELAGWASGFVGERWGGRLEVTAAADPDDGDEVRLDGSYFAGKFGNWIVTAGAQDRWWGSGWEGSLILSNNARPVPAIALDRAVSEPFETKWLSWIGPWRLTTFMGYMDDDRGDHDNPLLFGMRVSARPLDGLEISLERTAQWCGDGRSCTWDDFWNLWSGNDNAGENVDPEDEPGNQLAGWDIRWASPIGDWPYALYFQHTGETIDNQIPRPYRSLELAGAEIWGESAGSSSWRVAAEWALTRCGGTEEGERLWDCAYNNAIFFAKGYRYNDRPVGHSMDGDGEMFSLRYVRIGEDEATWTAVTRYTKVNQGGAVPDLTHSFAPGAEDWISLDLTYRRPLADGWIEFSVGADQQDRDWNDSDALLARASVSWRYEL
jgi:hypothetical protein